MWSSIFLVFTEVKKLRKKQLFGRKGWVKVKKKHQIFVSSTYEDLKEERMAVTQAILESDCIPAGMELFPASNNKSWDIIKRVIDDSDYYLLIIAGKYGSTRKIGKQVISYTEMEYNYAVRTNKPIISFICSKKLSDMNFEKVESTPEGRLMLQNFINKVKGSQRNVSFWTNSGQLVSEIKTAIHSLIDDCPSSGWVKCSDLGISGLDIELNNINELTNRWGIEKIFRTRAEKNYESDRILENHNIKELDGIAFGLRSFRTSRARDVLECLNNGAIIRLLVMDPDSSFVIQRAVEEKEDPDAIAKSIRDLVHWADDLNSKSKGGKIEIKYYNSMTVDFYWRIDDKLYFGPYWYGTPSQQTITFKFVNNGIGYALYKDYFERLWNDGELTHYPES